MSQRFLTALPVYNEVHHVTGVLDEVRQYSPEVLVVDDGSSDGTSALLASYAGIHRVRHETNQGYGAALRTAFDFALRGGYDVLVTIDCDGQHQPKLIPDFVAACDDNVDIVSGSRYLKQFAGDVPAPEDRRQINRTITLEVNRALGLKLTDAFCGFKAYRVPALAKLSLTQTGYAMPLELWVQAVHAGFNVVELAVPLIYLEEERSFGGSLDNAGIRLAHYRDVLVRSLAAAGIDAGAMDAGGTGAAAHACQTEQRGRPELICGDAGE